MKNKGILKFFTGLSIGVGIGFATNSIGIGIGIGIAFGAAFSQGKTGWRNYENTFSCIRFNIIWFHYCLKIQAPMERCSRTF